MLVHPTGPSPHLIRKWWMINLTLKQKERKLRHCPLCRDFLDETITTCNSCITSYHASCAKEFKKCSTLGCLKPFVMPSLDAIIKKYASPRGPGRVTLSHDALRDLGRRNADDPFGLLEEERQASEEYRQINEKLSEIRKHGFIEQRSKNAQESTRIRHPGYMPKKPFPLMMYTLWLLFIILINFIIIAI